MARLAGWRRLFELVARPFRGPAAVDQEIALHLELQAADLVRRGWTPEAALAEAERRFGDAGYYRAHLLAIDSRGRRRAARREWWGEWRDDLRYVVRGLRRSPGFFAGVAVILALGIGVNAAMIGLVDRLLFKPPAHVVDPDRVARYTLRQTYDGVAFSNTSVTWREYEIQRDEMRSVESAAAFFTGAISEGRGEGAKKVRVTLATPSFFSLLGVRPGLGRFFGPAEDPDGGGNPVAVISDRLWNRQYRRDPGVLGEQLWLGRQRFTIIGVAPRYFTGVDLDAVDAWIPFRTGKPEFMGRSDEFYRTWNWQATKVLVRLKPGADPAAAAAEATTLYQRATAQVEDRKLAPGVVRFFPVIAGRGADESKEPMIAALLAGVSVLVLLITCANVANLVLARGLARRREIAVRLALGVGRRRLVRMLLLESLTLALVGGAAGVAIAYAGGTLIRRTLLPGIDFLEPPVDGRLLLAALLVSGLTAILIGLVPALRMSRPDLTVELKAGGSNAQGSAGRQHVRLRTGLLFAQSALSVILLVGAGLFLESFLRVSAVDFGFRPDAVLAAEVDLDVVDLDKSAQMDFYQRAAERLRHVPGLETVSIASANPFWTRYSTRVRLPGRDSLPRLKTGGPYYALVGPDYFRTMGIAIRRGRPFTDRDRPGAPPVMAVNETMARTLWPGGSPIGRCAFIGQDSLSCREVVAVVADANSESLERELTAAYYLPVEQAGPGLTRDRLLFIRATGDPRPLLPTVRREFLGLMPNLPFVDVRLLQDQIDPLVRPWRLSATLFGIMAGIALLVALVGLYSVLSYSVVQRSREFGIRTALGASVADVARIVLIEGQRVIALAVLIGLGTILVVGRWLVPFLFATSPRDPIVLAGVAVTLAFAALIGSLVPARRAARVEPMTALRME